MRGRPPLTSRKERKAPPFSNRKLARDNINVKWRRELDILDHQILIPQKIKTPVRSNWTNYLTRSGSLAPGLRKE